MINSFLILFCVLFMCAPGVEDNSADQADAKAALTTSHPLQAWPQDDTYFSSGVKNCLEEQYAERAEGDSEGLRLLDKLGNIHDNMLDIVQNLEINMKYSVDNDSMQTDIGYAVDMIAMLGIDETYICKEIATYMISGTTSPMYTTGEFNKMRKQISENIASAKEKFKMLLDESNSIEDALQLSIEAVEHAPSRQDQTQADIDTRILMLRGAPLDLRQDQIITLHRDIKLAVKLRIIDQKTAAVYNANINDMQAHKADPYPAESASTSSNQ